MTEIVKTNEPVLLLDLISKEDWKKRIQDALGARTHTFIATLVSLTKENPKLLECVPETVVSAALIATVMNLPVQNSLGMAYVIPYKAPSGKLLAQLQLGYRAFTALAIRSGEYSLIHPTEVYEGQLVSRNSFTGEFVFQEARKSDNVIGYTAYFKLHNGFSKQLYWSREEVLAHATKYSKSYAGQYKASSKWATDEIAMGKKTVLKMLIDKYGPKSIDMQTALTFDQSISTDGQQAQYLDNPEGNFITEVETEDGKGVIISESKAETASKIEAEFDKKATPKHNLPSFIKKKPASEPNNTEGEITALKERFKEMGCGTYKQIMDVVKYANPKETIPTPEDFFETVSEEFLPVFKEVQEKMTAAANQPGGGE